MRIDLHQLANQPGYGKAREAMKDAGAWNESALEGRLRRWRVAVGYSVEMTCEVKVYARSSDEAMELAEAAVEDGRGDFHEVAGNPYGANAARNPICIAELEG